MSVSVSVSVWWSNGGVEAVGGPLVPLTVRWMYGEAWITVDLRKLGAGGQRVDVARRRRKGVSRCSRLKGGYATQCDVLGDNYW